MTNRKIPRRVYHLAEATNGASIQESGRYAFVNARVFFWLAPERLNRQRAACEPRPQVVPTLDALALAEAYREFASVTPINAGNARREPAVRGAATFVPYANRRESAWASEAAALGTPSGAAVTRRWN